MSRRRPLLRVGLSLAVLFVAAGPPAASAYDLGLTVLSGIHVARESAFRDIYGAVIPVGLEVRFVTHGFGLSVGGFTLGKTGTAVSLDGGPGVYPVKIRMTALPVMAFFRIPRGRAHLDLGLGAVRTSFEETWSTGDFRVEGSAWGFLIGINAEYGLAPWLALSGSLRFSSAPTGRDSILGGAIDLGGFQALAGVTIRYGRKT
jgi:hypothetical protein